VGNLGIVEEEKDEESKLDNLTVISPLFLFRGMFAYWAWFHARLCNTNDILKLFTVYIIIYLFRKARIWFCTVVEEI